MESTNDVLHNSILVALILLIVGSDCQDQQSSGFISASESCGVNERWYRCKPCARTCHEVVTSQRAQCASKCFSGCSCKNGYAKDANRRCIREELCSNASEECYFCSQGRDQVCVLKLGQRVCNHRNSINSFPTLQDCLGSCGVDNNKNNSIAREPQGAQLPEPAPRWQCPVSGNRCRQCDKSQSGCFADVLSFQTEDDCAHFTKCVVDAKTHWQCIDEGTGCRECSREFGNCAVDRKLYQTEMECIESTNCEANKICFVCLTEDGDDGKLCSRGFGSICSRGSGMEKYDDLDGCIRFCGAENPKPQAITDEKVKAPKLTCFDGRCVECNDPFCPTARELLFENRNVCEAQCRDFENKFQETDDDIRWQCVTVGGACRPCHAHDGSCIADVRAFKTERNCLNNGKCFIRKDNKWQCLAGECRECSLSNGECAIDVPNFGTKKQCITNSKCTAERNEGWQCLENGCELCSRSEGTCVEDIFVFLGENECLDECKTESDHPDFINPGPESLDPSRAFSLDTKVKEQLTGDKLLPRALTKSKFALQTIRYQCSSETSCTECILSSAPNNRGDTCDPNKGMYRSEKRCQANTWWCKSAGDAGKVQRPKIKCGNNEEFVTADEICYPAFCLPSCKNPSPTHHCPKRKCFEGCICKHGFYRRGAAGNPQGGSCVPARECKQTGPCPEKIFGLYSPRGQLPADLTLPVCQDNGDFDPIQCIYWPEPNCFCVNEKTNKMIPGTRVVGGNPDCSKFKSRPTELPTDSNPSPKVSHLPLRRVLLNLDGTPGTVKRPNGPQAKTVPTDSGAGSSSSPAASQVPPRRVLADLGDNPGSTDRFNVKDASADSNQREPSSPVSASQVPAGKVHTNPEGTKRNGIRPTSPGAPHPPSATPPPKWMISHPLEPGNVDDVSDISNPLLLPSTGRSCRAINKFPKYCRTVAGSYSPRLFCKWRGMDEICGKFCCKNE